MLKSRGKRRFNQKPGKFQMKPQEKHALNGDLFQLRL